MVSIRGGAAAASLMTIGGTRTLEGFRCALASSVWSQWPAEDFAADPPGYFGRS